MRRRTRGRGFTLIEAIIALFLAFLAGVTVYGLMSTSDQAYGQSMQVRMALRLAEQNLALVNGGTLSKTSQTLPSQSLVLGKAPIVYNQALAVSNSGSLLLLRSQVSWSFGSQKHQLELKTLVSP